MCSVMHSQLLHAELLEPQIKFQQFTIKDGLSQSYVYDIVEDHQGFIWIATQEGLNRYDGSEFVHYKNNILLDNTVANNFIRKLLIDSSGVLWVGTQNGLSKYNRQTDSFDNYFHDSSQKLSLQDNIIWDIFEDKDKTLWVATESGLQYFNSQENNFNRIRIRNYENKLKEIKTIFQDNQGNYWLGTYENGIFIISSDLSNAVSLNDDNKWGLSIKAKRLSDVVIVDNDLWLATDNGIYIVNNKYELKHHYNTENTKNLLPSNSVQSINQINPTQVWIGTTHGLALLNLHNKEFKNIANSNNTIFKLYKDNANKVWVGTDNGIKFFSPISMLFRHKLFKENPSNQIIDALSELSDNKILIARGDGSIVVSQNNQLYTLPLKFDENIFDLITISENKTLIRTSQNKLFEYDLQQNTIKEHEKWLTDSNYTSKSSISSYNNFIWFFDSEGTLNSYQLETQTFQNFSKIITEDITSIGEGDSQNSQYLWISLKNNSVIKFSRDSYSIEQNFQLKATDFLVTNARSIVQSNKWLWLTSFDQGIMLFNTEDQSSKVFNSSQQLINNTINGIIIDDEDRAWFTTNKGISSINPNTKSLINYGEQFGVENNEFISGSILFSNNKIGYFGGLSGFYESNLNEITNIKQKLNSPVLTNLLVANKKIGIANSLNFDKKNDFSLKEHINSTQLLTLRHEQSPFSIEFVSPNAKLTNQLKYEYKLYGLEESWIGTDFDNTRATYTNLDAGEYVFEVRVIDLLNSTNTKTKSLKINVMPPWWLSNSAILLYALLAIFIISYLFQQMRHKRLYHLQIKLSEERLKLSLWGSGDEMWDWNIKNGKIFRSNIWGILEFPQDGKRNVGADQTNIHQQDIPRVREALAEHFDKKTEHFESTYRVKDKDDKWIWVLDRGKIVERDDDDQPTRMTGTLKDISQIKRADERLKLFAKCIENISDAVVIYDRQFTVVDVNKAYQRITKHNKKQMLGTTLRFNRYPESFTQNVKKHLITQGGWHGEIENKRDNGEVYITDLNIDIIKDENNNTSHFVGVFSDVTERKRNEAELRKLANSDTLTGLPNRSYFQANQTRLVKTKVPHALLVFDLDNFKKINDSMGHGVGDALLCKVAERLIASGRKQDAVYRLGGDEFSIVIENTNDIHTITTIAKQILSTIAQPMKLKNQEVVLYSSIGIVLYPEDGTTPQELLKNADTAMYHAKDGGGNKYQFFSDSMNKQAVKRLQIENLIRHGLKEDYFSVFYQPKIEINTGKVAGMEALVRFQTPSKGIISPVVFIPVSEETGQIIDIGEIVLRKSCIATKQWVDSGLFEGRIAVNLSAVQFTQPNLVGMIADILRESGLPAKHLELEITEGTVMDSPQKAIDTMLQIRAMGIHLSLDDFGTGYSSLAYLKKFPLNTLKIDKAFVDDIETSEQGRNMVATIVTIAHNLGLHVVAEGVENNQQLSFLSGLRCEQLQGYLYSKPLPENDFQKYLLSHQITDNSTSFHKI